MILRLHKSEFMHNCDIINYSNILLNIYNFIYEEVKKTDVYYFEI